MPGEVERLTLPVRGMHCAACVAKVERALTSVAGVDTATVNLATEKATITFDATRTDVPALQDAVAHAGYELVEPRPAAADAPDREQAARAEEQRRTDDGDDGLHGQGDQIKTAVCRVFDAHGTIRT